ncbi:hypothetical protein HOY82DRAFT_477813 [Tuber indicum]|nr:hypothetical protein HOY82DRAFT_477813 [Tuber indicum]
MILFSPAGLEAVRSVEEDLFDSNTILECFSTAYEPRAFPYQSLIFLLCIPCTFLVSSILLYPFFSFFSCSGFGRIFLPFSLLVMALSLSHSASFSPFLLFLTFSISLRT